MARRHKRERKTREPGLPYVLTGEQSLRLAKRLNLKVEHPVLDPLEVPEKLRGLIPLAEEFGISDDVFREQYAKAAGPGTSDRIRAALAPFEVQLDQWLAGPAANAPPYSPEYVAFSCLRMLY